MFPHPSSRSSICGIPALEGKLYVNMLIVYKGHQQCLCYCIQFVNTYLSKVVTMSYTRNERVDILLILGECHKDAEEESRMFALHYSDRRHPVPIMFERTEQNVRNWIIDRKPYIRHATATSEANVVIVLGADAPWTHITSQETHGPDFNHRLRFCKWIQAHGIQDMLLFILLSDEATFTNICEVNHYSIHYWEAKNPHWVQHVFYQQRWSSPWGFLVPYRAPPQVADRGRLTRYGGYQGNKIPGADQN